MNRHKQLRIVNDLIKYILESPSLFPNDEEPVLDSGKELVNFLKSELPNNTNSIDSDNFKNWLNVFCSKKEDGRYIYTQREIHTKDELYKIFRCQ